LSIHPFADLAVFPRYQIILIQRLNLILTGLGAATAAAFGKLPDLGCALAAFCFAAIKGTDRLQSLIFSLSATTENPFPTQR